MTVSKLTVLDFGADWCGPCKVLAPVVDKVSKEFQEIEITYIDVDTDQDTTKTYNVRSVPTLIFCKDGVAQFQTVGAISEEKVRDSFTKLSKC